MTDIIEGSSIVEKKQNQLEKVGKKTNQSDYHSYAAVLLLQIKQ